MCLCPGHRLQFSSAYTCISKVGIIVGGQVRGQFRGKVRGWAVFWGEGTFFSCGKESRITCLSLRRSCVCVRGGLVCVCVCTCIYIHVCMYFVCMYVHVYIYIHTHTHTHVDTYMYTYIHLYTHTLDKERALSEAEAVAILKSQDWVVFCTVVLLGHSLVRIFAQVISRTEELNSRDSVHILKSQYRVALFFFGLFFSCFIFRAQLRRLCPHSLTSVQSGSI
jgi:hypothetical protein